MKSFRSCSTRATGRGRTCVSGFPSCDASGSIPWCPTWARCGAESSISGMATTTTAVIRSDGSPRCSRFAPCEAAPRRSAWGSSDRPTRPISDTVTDGSITNIKRRRSIFGVWSGSIEGCYTMGCVWPVRSPSEATRKCCESCWSACRRPTARSLRAARPTARANTAETVKNALLFMRCSLRRGPDAAWPRESFDRTCSKTWNSIGRGSTHATEHRSPVWVPAPKYGMSWKGWSSPVGSPRSCVGGPTARCATRGFFRNIVG